MKHSFKKYLIVVLTLLALMFSSLGVTPAYAVDLTPPIVLQVTSTTPDGYFKVGNTIDVLVIFNEAVVVTGTPQLTLETGAIDRTVDYVSTSGPDTLLFNYIVQAGDTSADLDYASANSLTLNGGTIYDLAPGTPNPAVLTLPAPGAESSFGWWNNFVIDTTAPTISIGAPSISITKSGPVIFTVTYVDTNFKSSTLAAGDITLNTTGSATGTVGVSAGTGATRTVTISSITGSGTLGISIAADTATDLATNSAPAASPSGTFTVDDTAPTVTNVTSTAADGSYKTGDTIAITVAFSESVTVIGTPQLTLETGTTDRTANYASGTSTATLTFNYIVQAGDASGDLDYVATTSLGLNGGTIKDAASNPAVLTLASPGATNSLGANKAIMIDTTAPAVTIFTVPATSTSLSISIPAFTATDLVGVTGYLITTSATVPLASAVGWSGTAPTTYSVLANGTYTLYPWAKNALGNVSAVFGTPPTVIVTDTTSPAVISSLSTNLTSTTIDFIVTFSVSVTGVDITDFTLTTTGVSGPAISGVSGSGSIYTVTINTGSGSGTIRLNVMDNDSILNASSIPLGGAGADNGNFTSGETFTITKTWIFGDVPALYWANSFIERLYNAGITGGCSLTPLNYCPDNTVTRAQMAVFLLKGIHTSSYSPPVVGVDTGFTDVPVDYWAAAWIKQLAAEGITGGCGAGIYCPDATVTRAQMAIFLLKAKYTAVYTPPTASGVFTDVPLGYWADKWIEQLAVEGITSGCGAGTYCPDAGVTRAQMAVFLVKTFGLP